jgi:hypothetical protein
VGPDKGDFEKFWVQKIFFKPTYQNCSGDLWEHEYAIQTKPRPLLFEIFKFQKSMDGLRGLLVSHRIADFVSAPALIPVGIPLERQTRPTPKLAFLKAPAGMPKSLTAGLPFLLDSHRNGLNLTRPSPSESPRGTLGSYPVFHLHQRSQRTTGQAERNSKP